VTVNTHGLRIEFGKHKGELWTRLPVSYLKWIINTPMVGGNNVARQTAQSELHRRGTFTPTIDVSGHAIDRASLSCRKIWHQNRQEQEGLHAWLCRVSAQALEAGEKMEGDKVRYMGMLFVFEHGSCWPVVKTVMPA
jgi:hypothetical protein